MQIERKSYNNNYKFEKLWYVWIFVFQSRRKVYIDLDFFLINLEIVRDWE